MALANTAFLSLIFVVLSASKLQAYCNAPWPPFGNLSAFTGKVYFNALVLFCPVHLCVVTKISYLATCRSARNTEEQSRDRNDNFINL